MTKKSKKVFFSISIFVCIIFIFSCGGSKSVKFQKESMWEKNAPIEKTYKKIIIQKFEVDQDMEKDYPGATVTCESTAMNELLKKSDVPKIEKVRSNLSREAGALIVKTRVTTLRTIGSTGRGLGGAFVGSPEMAVNLKLIDAATGRTLREKNLSTANNPPVVSSSNGSADRTLPLDMGKIIAQYIAEVVRGN
jgi:hypothetical protein